ncbi:MAG: gliding motility protein, partial [Runella sp.]
IWAYFLDRKILFETREAEKERFIGDRPATVEISQYCPGGIARWVGWRIVSRYLAQNPKIELRQLMENTDVRQILEGSKYKGQVDEE